MGMHNILECILTCDNLRDQCRKLFCGVEKATSHTPHDIWNRSGLAIVQEKNGSSPDMRQVFSSVWVRYLYLLCPTIIFLIWVLFSPSTTLSKDPCDWYWWFWSRQIRCSIRGTSDLLISYVISCGNMKLYLRLHSNWMILPNFISNINLKTPQVILYNHLILLSWTRDSLLDGSKWWWRKRFCAPRVGESFFER